MKKDEEWKMKNEQGSMINKEWTMKNEQGSMIIEQWTMKNKQGSEKHCRMNDEERTRINDE